MRKVVSGEKKKKKKKKKNRAPVCAGVTLRVVREAAGPNLTPQSFTQHLLYTHCILSAFRGIFCLRTDNLSALLTIKKSLFLNSILIVNSNHINTF